MFVCLHACACIMQIFVCMCVAIVRSAPPSSGEAQMQDSHQGQVDPQEGREHADSISWGEPQLGGR